MISEPPVDEDVELSDDLPCLSLGLRSITYSLKQSRLQVGIEVLRCRGGAESE